MANSGLILVALPMRILAFLAAGGGTNLGVGKRENENLECIYKTTVHPTIRRNEKKEKKNKITILQ